MDSKELNKIVTALHERIIADSLSEEGYKQTAISPVHWVSIIPNTKGAKVQGPAKVNLEQIRASKDRVEYSMQLLDDALLFWPGLIETRFDEGRLFINFVLEDNKQFDPALVESSDKILLFVKSERADVESVRTRLVAREWCRGVSEYAIHADNQLACKHVVAASDELHLANAIYIPIALFIEAFAQQETRSVQFELEWPEAEEEFFSLQTNIFPFIEASAMLNSVLRDSEGDGRILLPAPSGDKAYLRNQSYVTFVNRVESNGVAVEHIQQSLTDFWWREETIGAEPAIYLSKTNVEVNIRYQYLPAPTVNEGFSLRHNGRGVEVTWIEEASGLQKPNVKFTTDMYHEFQEYSRPLVSKVDLLNFLRSGNFLACQQYLNLNAVSITPMINYVTGQTVIDIFVRISIKDGVKVSDRQKKDWIALFKLGAAKHSSLGTVYQFDIVEADTMSNALSGAAAEPLSES